MITSTIRASWCCRLTCPRLAYIKKKQKKKETGFLWPCSYWCCASNLFSPEMLENLLMFEPQLATSITSFLRIQGLTHYKWAIDFLAVNQITHNNSLLYNSSVSEGYASLYPFRCVKSLKLGDHSKNRPTHVNVPPGFT